MLLVKVHEPEFAAIHRVADKLQPDLRKAFLTALDTLSSQLPLNTLTELVEAGNVTAIGEMVAALELPTKAMADAQKIIGQAIAGAGDVTASGFGLSFTLDNPAVLRVVDTTTGKLLVNITGETRRAVADIVRAGFIEGIPPRTQAREIRRIVGLTQRDAGAVDRFLRGQLEAGIDPKRADLMADRMRNRLLRNRAENIARTETIAAANKGQTMAWDQAADAGMIDRQTTREVWIATEDERLCPICAVLDGQTISFGGTFTSSVQATGFDIQPAGTIEGTPVKDVKVTGLKPLNNPVSTREPPAHPRCRCATGLVFDTVPQPAIQPEASTTPPVLTDEQWAILDPDRLKGRSSLRSTLDDAEAEFFAALNATDDGKSFATFVDKWQNAKTGQTRLRNDLAKILDGASADTPALKRAQSFLDALRQSPFQSPELHRGIALKGKLDSVLKQFVPGTTLDINASSFTSARKVAQNFAGRSATGSKPTRVIFRLVGDNQSMPIMNNRWLREKEWVAGGKFRILEVKKVSGTVNVTIEQIAGL